MDQVRAPFSEAQVASLNGYQLSGALHPFTCGISNHGGYDELWAYRGGWACIQPDCLYIQEWAHAFMADWSWLSVRRGEPRHTDEPRNHMGTRGFIGFVADGEMKIGYNHFDSYPGYLGLKVLEWLREADKDHVRNLAVYLRTVTDETPPTEIEISRCVALGSPEHGQKLGENPSWYWLLRGTQGDPEKILKVGIMEDAINFPHDSLFCEWGYLVDFDEKVLEVYKGFQSEWHTEGRFWRAEDAGQEWKSVALLRSYPFEALPSDEQFAQDTEGAQ